MADILLSKLDEVSFKYYNERTLSLKQNMESENLLPQSDKLFVNYFMKLFNEYNVAQFCLYDKNGSIMLVHGSGKKSILLVHTERSLQQFLQLIHEDLEFQDVYNLVFTKQKIPFIDSKYGYENLERNMLELYLPDLLIGRETYYVHHLLID